MKEVHAVEFIYECNINSTNFFLSPQADIGQIGIEWLPIERIKQTQSDELTNTYQFPITTKDFLKEYFIDQILEPHKSKVFES